MFEYELTFFGLAVLLYTKKICQKLDLKIFFFLDVTEGKNSRFLMYRTLY